MPKSTPSTTRPSVAGFISTVQGHAKELPLLVKLAGELSTTAARAKAASFSEGDRQEIHALRNRLAGLCRPLEEKVRSTFSRLEKLTGHLKDGNVTGSGAAKMKAVVEITASEAKALRGSVKSAKEAVVSVAQLLELKSKGPEKPNPSTPRQRPATRTKAAANAPKAAAKVPGGAAKPVTKKVAKAEAEKEVKAALKRRTGRSAEPTKNAAAGAAKTTTPPVGPAAKPAKTVTPPPADAGPEKR